ncbi:MAG: GlsB/YeaQ/YmgE family stress response membrane protein [Acidobacteria bacterium]|nr:GlsB/YeaQ/YmgE family stress response membrane protein [Acidobacteriota bacterium]MCZ6725925.1 GlsB/YeaQ/YmgE family stress response membrane protein [Acidobacteriota bacterium]
MGLGSWIVMGLLAGVVAKFLLPGKDPGGCVMTVVIGSVGAVLGGLLATYLGFGGLSGFDVRSLVIATLGAFVLLLLLRVLKSGENEDD